MNREEREISISELLWKIVKEWRIVIVFAVVFAVALGAYKYHSDSAAIESSKNEAKVSIEDMEAGLSDDEVKSVEKAKEIQTQQAEKLKYQTESIMMNLNPYAENVATLQYYVDTDYTMNLSQDIEQDYTDELVSSYSTYIENGGLGNAALAAIGWDTDCAYFNELIKLGGRVTVDGNVTNSVAADGATFTIYVIGESEKNCAELSSIVQKIVADYQTKLVTEIGAHTLSLIDEYQSVIVDEALIAKQSDLNAQIANFQTQLDTLEATMSEAALAVLHQDEQQDTDEEANTETDTGAQLADIPASAHISVKYIILGFVLGIVIACVWIALRYILNCTVKTSGELTTLYGVRLFGDRHVADSKKKIFAGIDTWLNHLKNKNPLSAEEQQELILTNLRVTCKQESIQKIFATSSLHMSETDKEVVMNLTSSLKEYGIEMVYGDNILRNAASIEQMAEIGQVVVFEKLGRSDYTSIEKELTLCEEQKAKVLGVVVLG